MGKKCSKCRGVNTRAGQAYCLVCHAKYMRENRKQHRYLTAEARKRANARAYLNTYVRRGKVERPAECFTCRTAGPVEGHHHDYSKPLEVTWLCRSCHQEEHKKSPGVTGAKTLGVDEGISSQPGAVTPPSRIGG